MISVWTSHVCISFIYFFNEYLEKRGFVKCVLLMLQIVFEVTIGTSFTGDIALDDIKYFPGRCGENFMQ